MQTLNIITHKPGRTYQEPHFYILNKGINSGKPLKRCCPNCFVFVFKSLEEKESAYWLVYGLWRAKAFHQCLKGSVVYFISINDLKKLILAARFQAPANATQFSDSVQILKKLESLELQFLKNLKLIEEVRRAVFCRYIKR